MGTVIIAFVLQGRVRILSDEEGDPYTSDSINKACGYLARCQHEHIALRAASSITIVDVDSGESELWL